jgi:uncharacterized membrane protein YcaP (DUF421 family)
MQTFAALLDQALGLQAEHLNMAQMLLRTIIVYVYIVAAIRLGARRFFGQHALFDGVMIIVLGSVVSRAINGQAPFFPTLAATALLIALHWLTAYVAGKFRWFERVVEEEAIPLVKDGKLEYQNMRRVKMSEHDVIEALRLNGVDDPKHVKIAWIEANGRISVIKRAMVVDIDVKDGVQTVRIEVGS